MADKEKATSGHTGGQGNTQSNTEAAHPKYSMNGHHKTEPNFDAEIHEAFTPASELAAESKADQAEAALLGEGVHDEGNAQCVHLRYAGHFVYTEALGWLYYTGTHWSADIEFDDDSTLEPMPRSIRLRTSDFCELWLDGRLVHMTR